VKAAVRGIVASSFYMTPCRIDFGFTHAVCSVRFPSSFSTFENKVLAFFQYFSSVATAGSCVPGSKVLSFGPGSVSAVAFTEPVNAGSAAKASDSRFVWTNYKESSGSLSYSIYSLSHQT
jgi:hypothetical protein